MTPLFTVIIPTFNRGELACEAVASVLAQATDFAGEERDFEILVVDDGSTDGTADLIAARFGDALRLLQQANAGPGAARNAGAAAARGKYLAFLDSDDVWFPWTLAVYRQVLEHGPFSLLTSAPLDFRDAAELAVCRREKAAWARFPDFYAAGRRFRFAGSGAMLVARPAFLAVGGFTTAIRAAEDLDLVLKLGTALGYVYLERPAVIAYRQHFGNTIADLDAVLAGVRHLVERQRAGGYPGGRARRGERLRILSRFTRSASVAAARAGRAGEARRLFWATLPWNARLLRFRYLLGFPLLCLLSRIRRRSP